MLNVDIYTYLNAQNNIVSSIEGKYLSNATKIFLINATNEKNSAIIDYNYQTEDEEINEDELKADYINYLTTL